MLKFLPQWIHNAVVLLLTRQKENKYVRCYFWSFRLPVLCSCKKLGRKIKNTLMKTSIIVILILLLKVLVKRIYRGSVGKPVETVPQIFIDEKPIGSCTDFRNIDESWLMLSLRVKIGHLNLHSNQFNRLIKVQIFMCIIFAF